MKISLSKDKKWFILKSILVLLLFIGLGYLMYLQIIQNNNLPNTWNFIVTKIKHQGFFYLIILILVLTLNFVLEAFKWSYICNLFQKISFKIAIQSIFVSQFFAINTPSRSGDFLGKLFFLKKQNKVLGTFFSIYGNFSQSLVALFFGVLFFIIGQTNFDYHFIQGLKLFNYIIPILILLNIFLFFIFFKLSFFLVILNKFKVFKKHLLHFNIKKISLHFKGFVLFISMLRYFCSIISYICLMQLFEIQITWKIFLLVGVFLMCIYYIPSFSIADISVRGQIGIVILHSILPNDLLIVTITTTIWFLNLLLPALIGYFIIVFNKLKIVNK